MKFGTNVCQSHFPHLTRLHLHPMRKARSVRVKRHQSIKIEYTNCMATAQSATPNLRDFQHARREKTSCDGELMMSLRNHIAAFNKSASTVISCTEHLRLKASHWCTQLREAHFHKFNIIFYSHENGLLWFSYEHVGARWMNSLFKVQSVSASPQSVDCFLLFCFFRAIF